MLVLQINTHVFLRRIAAPLLGRKGGRGFALRQQHTKPQLAAAATAANRCPIPNLTTPLFQHIKECPEKIALRDTVGQYTYGNLMVSAEELARDITAKCQGKRGERVLFLCPNDANYVVSMWAIWMAGQIGVPLSPLHPSNSLLYFANDTGTGLILTTPQFAQQVQRIASNTGAQLMVLDDSLQKTASERKIEGVPNATVQGKMNGNEPALILYTSGTTGNPKGVVLTHCNLISQVNCLLEAWRWQRTDVLLHSLPLHHTHGIVNALLCPLCCGARVVMLPKFEPKSVWSHLLNIENDGYITIFMAVPTMYTLLIQEYNKCFRNDHKMADYIRNTLKTKVRLMVSGSAPLTMPTFNDWLQLSGHRLLERYGMTEIGMCLSNRYEPVADRLPGFVGGPLPGVSVQLVDEVGVTTVAASNIDGRVLAQQRAPSTTGELVVKGDCVFQEYWGRPEATKAALGGGGGWFRTGDICEYSLEKKRFRVLGRISTDIVKTGGYKVSCLEIETRLLEMPIVAECIVGGVSDDVYGQVVVALVVLQNDQSAGETTSAVEEILKWARAKLPKYSVPKQIHIVEEIQRNAMGKVNKKEVFAKYSSPKDGEKPIEKGR